MNFETVEMKSKSGKKFSLQVPETDRISPSTFIVAAHKTGSTLMNRITTEICKRAGVPHINVELSVWQQGVAISDWPNELYEFLDRPGYVFDSFRSLQKLPELGHFNTSPRIFLVRDPRDVAVSFYFSMLKSHTMPKKGGETARNIEKARALAEQKTLDAYVLDDDCGITLRNMQRFISFKDQPHTTFFRYEDIIFDKRNWTAQLAGLLGADLPVEVLNEIADKNDIRPTDEDPSRHVRQVTPGNYKKHLSVAATGFLQTRYAPIFDTFGYSVER